jgi:FtsZ-interacting cell division protein ZipA
MTSSNIVWIVIAAVVAVLLIAAVIFAASKARRRRHERQADEIREQAKVETARVDRRQALADETAAKARAAQAEAEAKAAEAARLQERAATHHSDAATSREQLQEQFKRADSIDPKVRTDARDTGTPPAHDRDEAGSEESAVPRTDPEAVRKDPASGSDNYRDTSNYRGASS